MTSDNEVGSEAALLRLRIALQLLKELQELYPMPPDPGGYEARILGFMSEDLARHGDIQIPLQMAKNCLQVVLNKIELESL